MIFASLSFPVYLSILIITTLNQMSIPGIVAIVPFKIKIF